MIPLSIKEKPRTWEDEAKLPPHLQTVTWQIRHGGDESIKTAMEGIKQ